MKLKIGDKVQLNWDLNYETATIRGFDWNEEKQAETAYSSDSWFYLHQISKINGIKVRDRIKLVYK